MIENVDYRFVPHAEKPELWAIRILKGDFIETVLAYHAIAFNEVKDCLTFNFVVVESPDKDAVEQNEELQKVAGDILNSIIESGIQDGTVQTKERNADES